MAPRAQPLRRDDQPAFVLHSWPYRETSLIVEAFTVDYGRVSLVARGARRPRSELRGLLQAFQPLHLSWSGQAEMKTLIKAEWRGGLPLVPASALLCGFYINELLLKLLAREDAHPALFAAYEGVLAELAGSGEQAPLLRRFEVGLLAELGYAPQLAREAATGAPLDPGASYHYVFDQGPRRAQPGGAGALVRGRTLLALAEGRYPDGETAAEAKRLMRELLDHHLEQRSMESRRVLQDLIALDEQGSNRRD
jgi:DNA repair protein RecO (recombination protein O)